MVLWSVYSNGVFALLKLKNDLRVLIEILLSDPRDNAIGAANRENIQQLLSSLVIYPFLYRASITVQDMQVLVAHARNEADQPALKVRAEILICRRYC